MLKKLTILIMTAAFVMPAFALEKAAEVTASKGRVEIVHGDAVMGKRAKSGSELILKDILRTKRRGYAEVGFIDGTNVKVFEKSRLTINGIDRTEDGYNAEIQKGKVLFNVEKMENVAGDFRVKTTNSIIGVKGTTFGVVSGGLVTIVEVYNGNVEVLATVDKADLDSGKIDVGAIEGTGKGGDAEANKGTLVANLSSGQGVVLSSSGDVQVYEFSNDGGSKSLIFKGEVTATKEEDGGDGDGGKGDDGSDGKDGDDDEDSVGSGDAGGNADDAAFGSIGLEEEADAGGNGDFEEPGETGSGFDAPNAGDGAGEMPGSGGDDPLDDLTPPEDPAKDIADATDDADDFYSDPDVRPDTDEQIDLATGIVNINITFK